jgi:hypothetical protein
MAKKKKGKKQPKPVDASRPATVSLDELVVGVPIYRTYVKPQRDARPGERGVPITHLAFLGEPTTLCGKNIAASGLEVIEPDENFPECVTCKAQRVR